LIEGKREKGELDDVEMRQREEGEETNVINFILTGWKGYCGNQG